MKNIKYILILIVTLISGLKAQNSEIFGEAIIKDIHRLSADSIQFDIVIKRLTEDWRYFANCTFQLSFDTTQFQYDNTNLVIRRGSSSLTPGIQAGNSNPLGGYTLTESIMKNLILIGILGPETIEESQLLNVNDEFLLGQYVIYSKDKSPIPVNLHWVGPTDYYQAAAYKIENDSLYDFITLYHKNDNLELNSRDNTNILFKETYLPFNYSILLEYFRAEYLTQKQVALTWKTLQEWNVVGFTIKKALRPSISYDPASLDYGVIYTWRKDTSNKFDPEMISKGNSNTGFFYGALPDSVEVRGKEYCYQLFCSFYDSLKKPIDEDFFLSQVCVPIPKAIIVKAEVVSSNPFKNEIEIQFTLSDDCLMTIAVYDLTGKEIGKIETPDTKEVFDKKFTNKGIHRVKFEPMPTVASGSYYTYLIAYPIDDNTVEISRAVIKIMNIK